MLFRCFLFFFFDKKKRKYLRPKEKKKNELGAPAPSDPSWLLVDCVIVSHHSSWRTLVVYHSALATNKSTL